MRKWRLTSIVLMTIFCSSASAATRSEMISMAAEKGEGTWRNVQGVVVNLSSRDIYTYALALCEAGMFPERLATLFETGAKMQDRDPASGTYGNFRWYWRETEIQDRNAVDFCMMGGALVWLRHQDKLNPAAKESLRETMEFAVEGCLRHRVGPDYTNISLMNALDLILLGEGLGREEVADEGYRRLTRFTQYTYENGVHEYCSPTYYGVDLECLGLIEAFAGRESGREQARALLELFWTDLAANWYAPSERLGGTCSRDYNYLMGTGMLDTSMQLHGWLKGAPSISASTVFRLIDRWEPSKELLQENRSLYPRWVRQSFGPRMDEFRTVQAYPDVVLSASSAFYGPMDLPLTVDLAGGRGKPRCYFIADGRDDPYGMKKIAAGAHTKAQHLRPFWTAAQRGNDALGLVAYSAENIENATVSLQSHFVMRRDVDQFWIGEERVDISQPKEQTYLVKPGTSVFLREGTAAVAVKVVGSAGLDGKSAVVQLVDDGNPFGVVRLTVRLSDAPGEFSGSVPFAAIWIRVGSGIQDDRAFAAWRSRFAAASSEGVRSAGGFGAEVAGEEGVVRVGVSDDLNPQKTRLLPAPEQVVLEVNGVDRGKDILSGLDLVTGFEKSITSMEVISLQENKPLYLEAESAAVGYSMEVSKDEKASGGHYVWDPGQAGEGGGGYGAMVWKLRVEKAGNYYLWGCVLAPTPSDDSFFLSVRTPEGEVLPKTYWPLVVSTEWTWLPIRLEGMKSVEPIDFPAGEVHLSVLSRENGAKLDRLCVTDVPEFKPGQ